MSDGADLLIVDGRVFDAYGPRDIVPYGSDIGPRPVGAAQRDRDQGRADRLDRPPGRGPARLAGPSHGGRGRARRPDHRRLRRRPHPRRRRRPGARPASTCSSSSRSRRSRPRSPAHAAARSGRCLGQGPGLDVRPVPRRPADRASSSTRSSPTGRRSCAATTAIPAGSTRAALRLAGIDRDTPDPADGVIVRDPATGEATGALKEGAQDLVTRHIPPPSDGRRPSTRCDAASRRCTRAGITAIQDAWVEPDEGRALAHPPRRRRPEAPDAARAPDAAGRDARRLGARRSTSTRRSSPTCAAARGWTPGSSRASPTASSRRGRRRCSIRTRTTPRPACPSGRRSSSTPSWPRRTGAAGSWRSTPSATRGIRMALDAYERPAAANRHAIATGGTASSTSRRSPVPTSRASPELGVVASMQPYHADPSPNQIDVWAGNIGPERAGQAWSWGSIRTAGGVIALGSDWPVVPFDPMLALNSAVNRQTKEGHRPAAGCRPRSCRCPRRWRPTGTVRPTRRSRTAERGTLRVGGDRRCRGP